MITDAINKEFDKARRRSWDRIYVFVDLHETILYPDYQFEKPEVKYYPFAKELLIHLSQRQDVCLVLWTCSHPHQIEYYKEIMKDDGILFDHVNCNPEVSTSEKYGYYNDKPYYNIMLDDKSGIVPEELPVILETFKKQDLLK